MAWLTGAHRHMLAHTPMAGVLGGSPRTSLDSPQVVLSRLGACPNVPVNDFLEEKDDPVRPPPKKTIQCF